MDMSTDTTTMATDRECVEIEGKARAATVMHWPELVRVFNRMRAAEKRNAELETEVLNAAFSPSIDENGAPVTWQERAEAAEQRYVELDRTSERELAACEKEREQWYAAFVNAGKLGEAAEKERDEWRNQALDAGQSLREMLRTGAPLAADYRRLCAALEQIAELDSTRTVWHARGIAQAALNGEQIVMRHTASATEIQGA